MCSVRSQVNEHIWLDLLFATSTCRSSFCEWIRPRFRTHPVANRHKALLVELMLKARVSAYSDVTEDAIIMMLVAKAQQIMLLLPVP